MNPWETEQSIPSNAAAPKDAGSHAAHTSGAHDLAMSEAANRKKLIHAQKLQALGSLAGGIVHDFNNVFAAILLQLDLAGEQPDIATIKEDLESAKASAVRGADLVKRLLAFCRPAPSVIRELQSCEMIQELVALLERTITRRIHITATTPEETWSIKGDENQIHLVLITLCLHARDAMPNGGAITIEISNTSLPNENSPAGLSGDFVHLTVSDTSPGMPLSTTERLFEPNFLTKESAQGCGLSLCVAQGIIIELGGWLQAESTVGQGTRFDVFLPRFFHQESYFDSRTPQVKSKVSCEGTETVLVVDGDEMMRNLLRAVLSYRGYKIVEASSSTEAMEKAFEANMPADLVLLSTDLPNSTAWGILSTLREKKPSLPVILTGAADCELKAKGIAEGAKTILHKPFSNLDLVQMVRETLNAAKS